MSALWRLKSPHTLFDIEFGKSVGQVLCAPAEMVRERAPQHPKRDSNTYNGAVAGGDT